MKYEVMQPHESPSATEAHGSGGSLSVPSDLVDKARSRLATMAGFLAALGLAATLMHAVFIPLGLGSAGNVAFNSLICVVSAAVYLVVRKQTPGPTRIFAITATYEIVLCFLASTGTQIYMQEYLGQPAPLSPATFLIILFPVVFPMRPRRALAVSLCAAATQPLGIAALDVAGLVSPQPRIYVWLSVSAVFAAIIAIFAARVLYGVSLEVARARQLGSYRLEDKLGSGGMGEVWRARHRLLARPAAIKLIRSETASEEERNRLLRRFEREAQATAGLNSPHTIQLYDFGVTEDGAYYYAMEYLDGIDLLTLVTEYGALSPARVVYILQQICDSLADAHDSGLVHRDIKPSNIFLCRKGRRCDFVKVLDFGLVALRSEPAGQGGEGRQTVDGFAVGTPGFMAPEVVSGEADQIDHRVDLYAVGCVAFWLLTGRRTFVRKTPLAEALAHASEEPPRPSQVAESDVPRALEDVVLACLRKAPGDRPQSAEELGGQLAALDIEPAWTQAQAQKWWQSRQPTGAARGGKGGNGDDEAETVVHPAVL